MSYGNIKGLRTRRWHTANLRRLVAVRRAAKTNAEAVPLKSEPFATLEEVREYLADDFIVCLLCGAERKALGVHLNKVHRVSADQYRELFGIPWTYPLQGVATLKLFHAHGKKMRQRYPNSLRPPSQPTLKKHKTLAPAVTNGQRQVLVSFADDLRTGEKTHYRRKPEVMAADKTRRESTDAARTKKRSAVKAIRNQKQERLCCQAERALAGHGGNQRAAARSLGWNSSTFRLRLRGIADAANEVRRRRYIKLCDRRPD